ncbi:hypothetical protein DITRI_Ditri06bG0147300 [Diplodiscus trichospermus]
MAAKSDNFGKVAAKPGEEEVDAVNKILETKLNQLSSISSSSNSFIFRAPRELRQVNARVFEPQIISIGPYHHNKDHLKAMEIHEVRYLRSFLKRTAKPLKTYVAASISMENRVRNCYAETVNMSPREFVLVMVLDGLFVVELIHKFVTASLGVENDDIFKQNLNLTILAQDLLLLENQLPFFVLNKFLLLTNMSEPRNFVFQASDFFSKLVPSLNLRIRYPLVIDDIKHLIGLIHDNGLLSTEGTKYRKPRLDAGEWNFIRSATELLERGIKFKKGKGNSLFDIKFKHGVMHIPTLIVDHDIDRILRNLIAYEQLNQGSSVVMDHARLMDCLINYADDVALLSDCGIIDNWLGSHEEVANMFNKINDYVYLSTANFYYSNLFVDVNEHCNRRLNLWKVQLRKKYFHTPWDWVLMSIVAAIILLLLSLGQTIFSVLSYFKSGN